VIDDRTRKAPASMIVSTINATKIPVCPNMSLPRYALADISTVRTALPVAQFADVIVRPFLARISTAVLGGWKRRSDQRNEINHNSEPY